MVPEAKLYKEFGINAELIIDHAWGREPCTIADIHAYRPIKHSISHSQILLRNYSYEEAYVPMREMVESLVLELLQIKGVTNHIHVHIGYADEMVRSTGGSKKLKQYTDSLQTLTAAVIKLYRMSRLQRAKQFMPFAALKGFEVLLAAVARPKEHRVELSEDQVDELNKVLQTIHCGEWVRIVYYNKQRYTELIGAVDMISAQMQIISVQGIDIPFRSIKELNLYDMTI